MVSESLIIKHFVILTESGSVFLAKYCKLLVPERALSVADVSKSDT